jgi:hypothetical protein
MGFQALFKSKFARVTVNNTTNARSMREFGRRATDIAADLERSNDPAKWVHGDISKSNLIFIRKEKLQRIVNAVTEGFITPPEADGLPERLAPVQFIQRQALILTADKELDELQVR